MKKILSFILSVVVVGNAFSAQQTLTTEKVASWMSKANANFTDLYTNKQNRVTGTCTGQAIQAVAADGTVTCVNVGGGSSMAWPDADGNYYAARNGAWTNLSGIFAAALGADVDFEYNGSIYHHASSISRTTSSSYLPGTTAYYQLKTAILYGTGKVGTTTGDGSRGTMLYSDGVHPTVAGAIAWADYIAARI